LSWTWPIISAMRVKCLRVRFRLRASLINIRVVYGRFLKKSTLYMHKVINTMRISFAIYSWKMARGGQHFACHPCHSPVIGKFFCQANSQNIERQGGCLFLYTMNKKVQIAPWNFLTGNNTRWVK
jgi:hypothetical protein